MANQQKNPAVATTSNVSITTLSVNIMVVQMNEKQTTLAKFKQFNEMPLINEDDSTLNGLIWGYVNYWWDNMDKRDRHFLFEVDGVLYRDLVNLRLSKDFVDSYNRDLPSGYCEIVGSIKTVFARIHAARLLDGYVPGIVKGQWARNWGSWMQVEETQLSVSVIPGTYPFNISHDELEYLVREDNNFGSRSKTKEKLCKLRDLNGKQCDLDTLRKEYQNSVKELKDYCSRWDDLMIQLRDAQHLFIAV